MAGLERDHLPLATQVVGSACDLAIFVLGAPLAVWVLVSIVIPGAAALGGYGAAPFVTYLEGVQRWEQRQAALATPHLAWGDRELLAAAWPYASALATVQRLVPDPGAADAAGSGDRVTRRLGQRIVGWVETVFHPVQRAWGTMFLTRGWYALQMLVLAAPGALLAFLTGEYAARRAQEQGRTPDPRRFQAWLGACRMALAGIPLAMALPVALPTVPTLAGCFLFALVAISRARACSIDG